MKKYICPAKGGVDDNPSNLCPREEITDLCCVSCEDVLCAGEHTCLKIKAQREAGEKVTSCGIPVGGWVPTTLTRSGKPRPSGGEF